MSALISLYGWTIVAGAVAAPALALLGAQLATRDRSLQTLCVSQGCLLGVLFGLGLLDWCEAPESWASTFPFVTALLFSALTFVATNELVAKRMASRNTFFAFVFALLVASGYLVTALFPHLESHMAQVYMGDLATLSTLGAKLTTFGFAASLVILFLRQRSITSRSFEWAVFGEIVSARDRSARERGFNLLSLAMLCLSVQYLGFLFTITALFLPTAMMGRTRAKGVKRHFVLCAGVSSVGTVAGFLLSLRFTRLPTVPTIAWLMFAAAMACLAWDRIQIQPETAPGLGRPEPDGRASEALV